MAVSNDLLVPLDDIITDDEELTAKKDQYAPSLLEGFTVNDSLYGLPNGTQTMVVYYNKHMFDDAGLEYPQDGWTWDQFRETAEKLTKDGVYGFCFPCTYFQLTPWWSTNNAALVGEDGETPTVNSEGIVEAVDFLNTMARRARKRNVSLAIISQRFQDFYEKPEAQAVLTSSDTKLFLAQDKSEIQYLKEVFKLSSGEANFLVTCQKGEGLLKVGADSAIIQITPTRKEFEFVETNLNKLVQKENNRYGNSY